MGKHNPLQIQSESSKIITYDGVILYERQWRPQKEPKAGLVLLHGICEHSGRYQEAGEYLAQRGYYVNALDLRGHGKSDGTLGFVNSFDEYLGDLEVYLARVWDRLPRKPVFILGHSMGGAISLLFSIRKKPDIRGLILSAPTISLDGHISLFLRKISLGLGKFFPKLGTVKLDINATSRDPKVIANRKKDPLVYHGRILARTGAELIRATKLIQAQMEQVPVPLLILHGESDRMVNIKGSKELFARAKEYDKTFKVYKDYYHELLNELGREQVFQDIVEWMDTRIRTAGR